MLTSSLSQKPVLNSLVLRERISPSDKKELGGKISNVRPPFSVFLKRIKEDSNRLDVQSSNNQLLRYNCVPAVLSSSEATALFCWLFTPPAKHFLAGHTWSFCWPQLWVLCSPWCSHPLLPSAPTPLLTRFVVSTLGKVHG